MPNQVEVTARDDRLVGRGGEDSLVFGADVDDGNRHRDVIGDFDASQDRILCEAGTRIAFVGERSVGLFIRFEDGVDPIIVCGNDPGAATTFRFVADLFTG